MIGPELLEVFQGPPNRPDEGTVDPFTEYELKAIDEYNRLMAVDVDDGFFEDVDIRILADQYGEDDAKLLIRNHLGRFEFWWVYLDALHATTADPYVDHGGHSNAMLRLLEYEATRYFGALNTARRVITQHYVGIAGPSPTDTGWALFSNGHIELSGEAVA